MSPTADGSSPTNSPTTRRRRAGATPAGTSEPTESVAQRRRARRGAPQLPPLEDAASLHEAAAAEPLAEPPAASSAPTASRAARRAARTRGGAAETPNSCESNPSGEGSNTRPITFTEGGNEDSLVAARKALEDVRPQGDDVAEGPASAAPPVSALRVPPPTSYPERVYRQDPQGQFACVSRSSSNLAGPLSASASLAATLRITSRGTVTGGGGGGSGAADADVGGSRGGVNGGRAGVSGGGGFLEPPASQQLPTPTELQLASALFHLLVAPTRFAAGLMLGAVLVEVLLIAELEKLPLDQTPLTPMLVYAPASINFYRMLLWTTVAAFVGTGCGILTRSRGEHYILLPWQRAIDLLQLLLYFINICADPPKRMAARACARTRPSVAPFPEIWLGCAASRVAKGSRGCSDSKCSRCRT